MPTYEYKCRACSHHFEYFQSMSEDPLHQCPQCDGKVYRLISKNVGISFKGGGFYATDTRPAGTDK